MTTRVSPSRLALIVVGGLAACRPEPPVASPDRAALAVGCARIDPSFPTLVVTARWHDRDVPVLVDTGANGGSIAASGATGLVPRTGEAVHFAGASGEVKESKVYDISGLSIGNATLAPFQAHVDEIGDELGYAFSIGLEHLSPYIVDFDVDDGWFCLRDQLRDPPALSPMTLAREGQGDDKAISLDATFTGTPIASLILDTGAAVSTVNADLLPRFPYRRLGAKGESLDGSGVHQAEYFIEIESLCALGTCARRHVVMPGSDLSPLVGYTQRGIIGVPFLRGHRVILDFPHRRIAIAPRQAQ